MGSVIKNILVRVGADINGYQKNLNQAQATMRNFAAQQKRALGSMSGSTKNAMAGAGASAAGLAATMAVVKGSMVAMAAAAAVAVAAIASGVKPAMEYESSLQQVNRIMGESAKGFVDWADTQATAFNMSRVEAMKYGSVYGNLLSGISSSQAQTMQYTTDLLKASAVVASATGRTMEDVQSRIRSGLLGETEAVEDLGIQVQVAALEGTAAFQRFANGKSWDQLSFATQQQVRYFAILEQASNKFGNSVYNNTASGLAQFTAILKDAQLNIGQAFLPVINSVMPVLIRLANGLKYVTAVYSQFMQALFGVKTKQVEVTQAVNSTATAAQNAAAAQDNLGGAVKKAAAAAKGSLASFDEINQLQEQTAVSADDAAGGIGGGAIGGGSMTVPGTSAGAGEVAVPSGILNMAKRVREALAPIGAYLNELGTMFKNFWAKVQPALQPIIDFMVRVFTPVWRGLVDIVKVVFDTIKNVIQGALLIIQGVIEVFSGILTGNWSMVWQGIKDVVTGAWTVVKAITEGTMRVMEILWRTFIQTLMVVWQTAWNSIKTFAASAWEGIRSIAATAWEGIRLAISGTWTWLSTQATAIFGGIRTSVINAFSGLSTALSNIWNGIMTEVSTIWNEIYAIIKGVVNSIIGAVNKMIDCINGIQIDVPSWVTEVSGINDWKGFQIPKIPKLAEGGVTNGPTLAMIGDNPGGREVVSPLNSLEDMIASAVGNAMLSVMQLTQPGNGNSTQGEAAFYLDGDKFARAITPLIDKERSRKGTMAISTI